MKLQHRYSQQFDSGLLVRADGEKGSTRVYGTAVPWDKRSLPLFHDWTTGKPVVERFLRGAFKNVLAAPGVDVLALREHDRGRLLGRTSSGTLRIVESSQGLDYDLDPPDIEEGRSLVVLAQRGDLRGSSFSFAADDEGVEFSDEGDYILRTISRVSLLDDVSPVTRPAYPDSSVGARSAELADLAEELKQWRRGGQEALVDYYREQARLIEAGL